MALFDFLDPFDMKKLSSMRDQMSKGAKNDDRPDAKPRKGLWPFMNNTINKKQQRLFTLNAETLGRLANADPITWSIRRTIKAFVNQAQWDIEVDVEEIEQELDRWEEYALSHLSPYAIGDLREFETDRIEDDLKREIESQLKKIMKEPTAMSEKKKAVEWYFASVLRQIKAEAEAHRWPVKAIFEKPSERGIENTFRTLQDLVVDDVLIYDAGCMVKNWNRGGELAELYHVPGKDIRIFRNEDRTIPEPPEAAYVWEDNGIIRAEFTRDELVNIVQNPQASGYGMSPLEVAAYVITASIYADEYNIDYFKNSNVPPGVFDLGKDIPEDQRLLFQQMWENEVRGRGGLHRMLFMSGSEDAKFIPIRQHNNRDMQMMEYLKWTLAVKTACYGLSGQDIGFVVDYHRTTGETQRDITQARGVQTILHLLAQKYNTEIVKKEYPFKDVKFAWKDLDVSDEKKESEIDAVDINSGVLNRNDRRKKLGLKPIEGGDVNTVTMAGQLVPVSELQKYEEGREDLEEQAMGGQPGAPQDATQTPQPGQPTQPGQPPQEENANGQQVPQETKSPIIGAPLEAMEKAPGNLDVKVNRRVPVKRQYELLHNVVKELQNKGIEATIKIGFEDNRPPITKDEKSK